MTRASVLIPTHNRPDTLELAVSSVRAQTVDDLEVLIIGDGITDPVRRSAEALQRADPRVRLLDLPKGEHHGEVHRHDAIESARSNAIFYLCDDDLLLPTHVESLLGLLDRHTLVQCLNGAVLPDGRMLRYPGSLADGRALAGMRRAHPQDNFVSITGTAHRRDFYLDGGAFWEPTPPGDWPDRYQWNRMTRLPGFSGATSSRMTALQFPATAVERAGWDAAQGLAELRTWASLVGRPDAQERIDGLVADATEADLGTWYVTARGREEQILDLEAEIRDLRAQLAAHRATLSWRITRPLRAIRSATTRS